MAVLQNALGAGLIQDFEFTLITKYFVHLGELPYSPSGTSIVECGSVVAQLCPVLVTPLTSLPDFSVHDILQSRTLGCVVKIPFSNRSS